jgi:hypothetical protein
VHLGSSSLSGLQYSNHLEASKLIKGVAVRRPLRKSPWTKIAWPLSDACLPFCCAALLSAVLHFAVLCFDVRCASKTVFPFAGVTGTEPCSALSLPAQSWLAVEGRTRQASKT